MQNFPPVWGFPLSISLFFPSKSQNFHARSFPFACFFPGLAIYFPKSYPGFQVYFNFTALLSKMELADKGTHQAATQQ